jgi:hypothetical protein
MPSLPSQASEQRHNLCAQLAACPELAALKKTNELVAVFFNDDALIATRGGRRGLHIADCTLDD